MMISATRVGASAGGRPAQVSTALAANILRHDDLGDPRRRVGRRPTRTGHVINAPALALLGRPLIGNGANGAPGDRGKRVINAPALALLGRPLIGNGANGAPGDRGKRVINAWPGSFPSWW